MNRFEHTLHPHWCAPGIKAGMFVRDAKARCPHLMIVPYNFDAYEEVYFLRILDSPFDG